LVFNFIYKKDKQYFCKVNYLIHKPTKEKLFALSYGFKTKGKQLKVKTFQINSWI